MNKDNQVMQGGYRQLDKDGNVVEEHQTRPRLSKKEQAAADAKAADKKPRRPNDSSPAGVDTNTTGVEQS